MEGSSSGAPEQEDEMDQRPFKPLSQGTNPTNGQTWVIHEGQAQPAAWNLYYHDSHPLAVELLRLCRLEAERREGEERLEQRARRLPDPLTAQRREPVTLPAFPLFIVDSGHWGTVNDGGPLFSIYLGGDSIEGRRSPDAEKRLGVLQAMVGCWEYMRGNGFPPALHWLDPPQREGEAQPVPIVRTYRPASTADNLGHTWFCSSPDCPGLPYKASEQRHPCGGSDAQ